MSVQLRPRRDQRRAFTIVELTVSLLILATALAAAAQLLAVTARHSLALERRALAAQEAANLMERIASRPFGEVTRQYVQSLSLSEEARRRLPDPQLQIEVTAETEQPPGKRILVEVQWRDRSGGWSAPIRLVAWRSRIEEPEL